MNGMKTVAGCSRIPGISGWHPAVSIPSLSPLITAIGSEKATAKNGRSRRDSNPPNDWRLHLSHLGTIVPIGSLVEFDRDFPLREAKGLTAKSQGQRVKGKGALLLALCPLRLIARQPALQHRVTYYVDAAAEAQLFHAVGFVRFNGLDAEFHLRGDLFVAITPGDCLEHLELAVTTSDWSLVSAIQSADVSAHDSASNRWIEVTITGGNCAYGMKQFDGRALLEHIA